MSVIASILGIIIGGAMVIYGADRLTEGSVALARRLKMSEMVIGLTIVAFGTSMPEFVISLVSGIKGSADIAVGNIVGSNIFNTLMIVGMSALVCPITIARTTVKRDIPFTVLASILMINVWSYTKGSQLTAIDGSILLLLFTAFMFITFKGNSNSIQNNGEIKKNITLFHTIIYIILGLILLIGGSEIFVSYAKKIALSLNVSESVIGLTIVACGTSLPELATSVVAAKKGRSELAIGNVLGSNVFNILWILGFTSLICPLNIQGMNITDFAVMLGSILLVWLFAFTSYKIKRWEGAVLVTIFLLYTIYLIIKA